jgi:heme a synthase
MRVGEILASMENIRLHRYSVFLACCTLLLVAAGATVTSKEAGLSVPDWPLSYGQVMPPMTGNIFYEHGHRMIASAVGFLTIILTVWLWRSNEPKWLRRLGLVALGLVIVQGTLGGLTVLYLLPPAVSILHACTAQAFFTLTCSIALFTSPSWKGSWIPKEDATGLRSMVLAMPVSVFVQLALGAAYRHKVIALPWHVGGAMMVAAVVFFVGVFALLQLREQTQIRKWTIAALVVTGFQVFLGVAAYMARVATADDPQPMPVMILFTVAHVATGALTLAVNTMLAIQVRRLAQEAQAPRMNDATKAALA